LTSESVVRCGMILFVIDRPSATTGDREFGNAPASSRWNNMPSANRTPVPEPLYWMDDLRVLRRDILLHAKSLPPGSKRNQHRQIALSLRRLLKNENWLNAHTLDG
jgi:hypothetical protein